MLSLVILDDRVMFPDGPTVYLYDDYASARAHHDVKTLTFRRSDDGKIRLFWMTLGAAALLGLEPAAFVDRTTRPWPAEAKQMIHWRALRAGAAITREA